MVIVLGFIATPAFAKKQSSGGGNALNEGQSGQPTARGGHGGANTGGGAGGGQHGADGGTGIVIVKY